MRSYAVVWSTGPGFGSGRLEAFADRFELHGRDNSLTISFSELDSACISRRYADRLRGLPVLTLARRDCEVVRIASLEGAAVLHELVRQAEHAGLVAA